MLFSLPAWANDAEEPGKLAAVQKRKFRLDHEIYAAANYLPRDAFYKGIGPNVSYTLHFNDQVGWEMVRGVYSFRYGTGLREQLRDDWAVAPTSFDEMEWMVGSAIMFTPFYGKFSMTNRSVMHSELFFLIGGTVGKFQNYYKPGPQAGAGLRFFLSESVSVRAEGRYHYLFSRNSTQLLDFSLGFSLNLGGAD